MHRPTNASVTELPASRDSRGSALMRFQATTRFTANVWGHLLTAKLVPAAHGFNKTEACSADTSSMRPPSILPKLAEAGSAGQDIVRCCRSGHR